MKHPLQLVLDKYRKSSKSEREKGTYFEFLIKDFLKHDPLYVSQFEDVWTYAEWAKERGKDQRDTGIDLVAKLKDEDGYCAIQCKFYDENYKIQKKDIDSFFTASGKVPFTRRLIVDTTRGDWSENAENALSGQIIGTNRISLKDLEESSIDWGAYAREQKITLAPKKTLFSHQKDALKAVIEGLADKDRGKLIMACGTGKTFTSLKIAESIAGAGGKVLYLVPSLSLMSQTVREWTNDSEIPLHSFAVCSDVQVGKRKANQDLSDINVHDLAYPATTKPAKLAEKFLISGSQSDKMTVVFSTYQSIQVISDSQKKYGLPVFDLIICDEAHRTTGAKLAGEDESNFIKVHYQDFIKGKKRIYMTATPRIFGDAVKTKAKEVEAVLCSMDDPELYGENLFEVSFSYSVQHDLLTDYKVIVLAVDEETVSTSIQNRLTDEDSELILDDVTKIIGCYRALTKLDLEQEVPDPDPMRRAVAFCKDIKSSKLIKREFSDVVEEYLNVQGPEDQEMLTCEVDHVDGTFNSKERNVLLDWLSEDSGPLNCRILSNARCLSEGVDVPALDAILFMHPRKSQIDVVQSVGRVMRRAPGKNMGYVILPIGVPAGIEPEEALNNNEKYKVVWQILNALRAHDDRFNSMINKIDLGVDVSSKIEIIAVTNQFPQRSSKKPETIDIGSVTSSGEEKIDDPPVPEPIGTQEPLPFDEFQKAILARIVKKCGTREYWEDWANDVAKIAKAHITRMNATLKEPDTKQRQAFDSFLEEIRDDLNDNITETDAIEMLAQHIITRPVFEALFDNYSFASSNPVSIAMQNVLEIFDDQKIYNENRSLEKFYHSVRLRAKGIDNDNAKQVIVIQLYEKFFKKAFPQMTEKLGIVYTPIEIVDFIIHSVNEVLKSEFGENLGSRGVHILDPFTGTGTFITRLLQSGLIHDDELEYKYKNEIHANEIILLAYYIAAINIEAAYHSLSGNEYLPFSGICLTDSFQLYEKEDMISRLLVDNSNRRQRQKDLDIRVIMGNPPYKGQQKDAGDNLAKVQYPGLDERIRSTYAIYTDAINKNSLYNSFIRAFRWASDRIGDTGILAYVSSASFIESSAAVGLRKCLSDEFSNLYIFNLRGDARSSGEKRRKESGNVFGDGSREPIAITIAVKNKESRDHGLIFYHELGDYLSRREKLDLIQLYADISGLNKEIGWRNILPDKHNDWINQRDDSFSHYFSIGNKKKKLDLTIFNNYSRGLATGRDAWCYSSSKTELVKNIESMSKFYNSEIDRYKSAGNVDIDDFINTDPKKISWNRSLKKDLKQLKYHFFDASSLFITSYRPYTKMWSYFNRQMNDMVYQMPKIFPEAGIRNRIITMTGVGSKGGYSVLITDHLPDLNMMAAGSQCFPLYLYEETKKTDNDLFSKKSSINGFKVMGGITDEALNHFNSAYPDEHITKEDIFYYIYGLLHSEEYREKYKHNLSKELPRIPYVKKAEDFWTFSKSGRDLGDLHVNYEEVDPYPVTLNGGTQELLSKDEPYYRVEKMKFGGKGKNKDKTTVIYNSNITISDIPIEAYEYVVNGKPALEWVIERQGVKTDKASGIVNDSNLYAIETVGDPAYPLKLFQRIITVSLETMKIVKSLPKLDVAEVEKKID